MSLRKGSASKYMNSTVSSWSSNKVKGATGASSAKKNITPRVLNQTDLNLNKKTKESGIPNLNTTVAAAVVSDGTPSHRCMQHKLDMAYNKYLQNLALHAFLTRLHREYELSIADQLLHFEQLYNQSVVEEQNSKYLLCEMKKGKDIEIRMQFLEKSLETVVCLISNETLVSKITKFNTELQVICNKFKLENQTFVQSTENYDELHRILNEILIIFDVIKSESSFDLVILAENIFKIFELLKHLRQNHDTVVKYQAKVNKLALQVASMELS